MQYAIRTYINYRLLPPRRLQVDSAPPLVWIYAPDTSLPGFHVVVHPVTWQTIT